MELNITEPNNINTMNPYDTFDYNNFKNQPSENYWEKSVKTESKGKKKVSFDDILSNMNLVVNKQGILQFMVPKQQDHSQQTQQNQQNPSDGFYPRQQSARQREEPLEPSVKHSSIYNKYFKDYVDPNMPKSGPKVPKTIQEYKEMLLEYKINAIEHKKLMNKIKSTKLMFTNSPDSSFSPRNVVASSNNLRMMNFR